MSNEFPLYDVEKKIALLSKQIARLHNQLLENPKNIENLIREYETEIPDAATASEQAILNAQDSCKGYHEKIYNIIYSTYEKEYSQLSSILQARKVCPLSIILSKSK